MEPLWALAQAQEAARQAVENLIESAKRSKAHKQLCYKVAHAGREVFARLEAAVRERTGDALTLRSAAARLYVVVNSSRACVEQFGNPNRLERIMATIFQQPRKAAECALADHFTALVEVGEEYARLWTSAAPAPLRVATGAGPLASLPHSPMAQPLASLFWFGGGGRSSRQDARDIGNGEFAGLSPPSARNLVHALSSPLSTPFAPMDPPLAALGSSVPDLTPRARPRGVGALLPYCPSGVLAPQPSGNLGGGPGSESQLSLTPGAVGGDEAEAALRSGPFGQRSVRPSDGNAVQRLCFMRGAGGESATVALMVALDRQVEVYSLALDSFHSDTQIDAEADQVTATALYEPTVDLITGHRSGAVQIYGRVGPALLPRARNLRADVLSAAAAAEAPMERRLSSAAVTALYCVPAIELEAASAAAAAVATAAEAPSAPSPDAVASGAVGSCTADDVLLFMGDALGTVKALRYSRVQPDVLISNVFTNDRRGAFRSAHAPPPDPEITGLLYRAGFLIVSTPMEMYSLRVLTAPPRQPTNNNGNGGSNITGNGSGAAAGIVSGGTGADGHADGSNGNGGGNGTATGATRPEAALPQSPSVNPLSSATSALPCNGGGAITGGNSNNGFAAGGSTCGASGAGGESRSRRGLSITSTLVDSKPFGDWGSCTALVAIDWPVPDGSRLTALAAEDGSDNGAADAGGPGGGAPCTPRSGFNRGAPMGLGAAMPEASSLGRWASPTRSVVPGGGSFCAASTAAASGGGVPDRSPPFVSPRQGSWRLLTAHMNGQLLMWDAMAGQLNLICAIGPPGPPIVNVFTFPKLGILVELLSTGFMRVGPLPTSALAPPMSLLGVSVWKFARASIRAHRGRLTAGAALANCIATGSRAGGVKVWNVAGLRAQAARQGVAFLSPCRPGASVAAPASLPYAASDNHYNPRSRRTSRLGLPGPEDVPPPPPYHHHYNYHLPLGQPGGPPPGAGGIAVVTSGAASIASTAVHVPYPSNGVGGGPTYPPPFSRMPSGHTSLTSHMGVPHSSHPFSQHMQVPGPDAFGGTGGYAVLQQTSGSGVLTATAAAVAGAPSPHPHSQMHVPGPAGPTGDRHPVGLPLPAQHHPNPYSQQHQQPVARGLPATAPVSAPTPFSSNTAADSHDWPVLPRGGGGGAGEAAAGAERYPLANGHGGHGGSGGHAPLRSEDSGNLSASSSLNGPQKPHGPPTAPAQQQQQGRGSQGLRGATQPNPTVAHTGSNLSRMSDRTAGDATPTRHKTEHLTSTQRAVLHMIAPAAAMEETNSKNFPAVGPVGLDEGEAAAVEAATAAEAEAAAAAASAVGAKPGGNPASRAPSGREDLLQAPMPQYPLSPSPHLNHLQNQQYHPHQLHTAPPSPTPAGSSLGASSLLPPTVVRAAADPYGMSYGGGVLLPQQVSSAGPAYPNMPTVGTAALVQPPPYMSNVPSPAPPPYSGLAMPQGSHSQRLPLIDGVAPPPSYGGSVAYHSPGQPPPPHHHHHGGVGLYGNIPSPLHSGGGAAPMSPGMMLYGMNCTSEYGVGHQPPLYPAGAHEQHVPGAHLAASGRRPSNMSEYDMLMASGRVSPLPTQDSYEGGDVGLPPPPVVRPPPPTDPSAAHSPKDTQLSQNFFIKPEELRNVEQIGEGAEGVVYRGRWHHIDVAVKEMHPTSASFKGLVSLAKDLSGEDLGSARKDLANLINEGAALIDLGQHPNIIRFIGVCPAPPRIVTEYYKMGSLYTMLKDARQGNIRTREKLSWDRRLIMLRDIAAGMAYLHSRDYIHGDLRSPNVFVTEDQHLKIGDFGFARILSNTQDQPVPARLTNPRWQAPEVYEMLDPVATTAADVYSFGIIMYEMLTFRLPYDDETEDGKVLMRHTFDPSWRPTLPEDGQLPVQRNAYLEGHLPPMHRYKALMMDCWAEDPASRPGFHKVATRLSALCRWQWVIGQIQRSRYFKQRSRGNRSDIAGLGGLPPVTAVATTPTVVTPAATTPTATSPTAGGAEVGAGLAAAVAVVATPVPALALHAALGGMVAGLQERDSAVERRQMEGLRQKEPPFTAAPSPTAALTSTAPMPTAPSLGTPMLPMLPQLPPLNTGAAPLAAAVPPPGLPMPAQHGPATPPSSRSAPSVAASAVYPQPLTARTVSAAASSSYSRSASDGSPARLGVASGVSQLGHAGGRAARAVPAPAPAAAGDDSVNAAYAGPRQSFVISTPVSPAAMARAGPAAAAEPEPVLEPAPTLASSGSRPLQVPAAAGTPPQVHPGPPQLPPAPPPPPLPPAAAAAPFPLRPQPAFPAPGGGGGDGHALLSPFQGMTFSDDEDDQAADRTTPTVTRPASRAAGPVATGAIARPPQPQPQPGSYSQQQNAYGAARAAFPPYAAGGSQGWQPAAAAPHAEPPPHPAMLGTVSSVAAPAISLMPGRMAAAPAAPPSFVASPAPVRSGQGQPGLQRGPPSQPHTSPDPLEMRTAFHMGIGFSIDDDEDE